MYLIANSFTARKGGDRRKKKAVIMGRAQEAVSQTGLAGQLW